MGRRLDNGSRVNREIYARFCERLWVKPPRPTHPCILVKGVWKYLYRAPPWTNKEKRSTSC